ncbi:MAG: helix-turn-helix domain-containing protein [Actinomycetia bacterium]|nr:helix-turn-helix domain-containing protein [Actinomycetes bacterium]
MQGKHTTQERSAQPLLTAREVQEILHVDRSTVYRMAESGRLPAVRVGKQWRFPAEAITGIISAIDVGRMSEPRQSQRTANPSQNQGTAPRPIDPARAEAAIAVAAPILGVMMVVTDMTATPVTPIANPCPAAAALQHDAAGLDACLREWQGLADDQNFQPSFQLGPLGFECARAFVRSGNTLVGMVIAGGVAPRTPDAMSSNEGDGLYHLDDQARSQILATLPGIAVAVAGGHDKSVTFNQKGAK